MASLLNVTTNTIVATRMDALSNVLQRAVGLLTRARVGPDEGVWIAPCRAIHTLGMRTAIDVIFVDAEGRVVRIEPNVKPNRFALTCRGAAAVVELGCDTLRTVNILPGDRLQLV